MDKTLVIFLITGALSFGSAWYVQDLRMENKLSQQTQDYQVAKDKAIQTLKDKLSKQEQESKASEKSYKDSIKDLEDEVTKQNERNVALVDSVNGLRNQERELRTRINSISEQALRNYAIGAAEAVSELAGALQEEQLAHQETSRKAEQFYLGWKALDDVWPKN